MQARGRYPHVCRLFNTVAAVPAVTVGGLYKLNPVDP
jgi:hypothetical protein